MIALAVFRTVNRMLSKVKDSVSRSCKNASPCLWIFVSIWWLCVGYNCVSVLL